MANSAVYRGSEVVEPDGDFKILFTLKNTNNKDYNLNFLSARSANSNTNIIKVVKNVNLLNPTYTVIKDGIEYTTADYVDGGEDELIFDSISTPTYFIADDLGIVIEEDETLSFMVKSSLQNTVSISARLLEKGGGPPFN